MDLIESAIIDCEQHDQEFQELINDIVKIERNIIQKYNAGTLEAPLMSYKPDPASQTFIQFVVDGSTIADDVAMFPIRASAVVHGVHFIEPEPLETTQLPSNAGSTEATELSVSRPLKHLIYNKLADAPSMNLPFPKGNLTAAEILAFCPEWVKSWDVVERFFSNGATPNVMTHMINHFRKMERGALKANSLNTAMKNAVGTRKEERYKNWRSSRHRAPGNWNAKDLDVGTFRIPNQTHKRTATNMPKSAAIPVPFYQLKEGVEHMPQGSDALDLTKCIEYHCTHQDEEWLFPTHFQALTQKLGGPVKVESSHYDTPTFERWRQVRTDFINAGGHKQVAQDDDVDAESDENSEGREGIAPRNHNVEEVEELGLQEDENQVRKAVGTGDEVDNEQDEM